MSSRAVAALCLALLSTPPAVAQDSVAGSGLFAEQCASCHSVTKGDNGTGPALAGMAGKPAGEVAGFSYSPAMKSSGKLWDDATLNLYLTNPKRAVPGTKMALGGIADPDDRANLIAYLKTLH